MSGEANGLTIDLKGAVDRDHVGDVGVPAGSELLAFTNAVQLDAGTDAIAAARAALADVIGDDATLEAAATIAIFNGLVRVADGTGIQLDEGVFAASVVEREFLDLNSFAGAANSADLVVADAPTSSTGLFG